VCATITETALKKLDNGAKVILAAKKDLDKIGEALISVSAFSADDKKRLKG
jgi:hypothetical protein